MSSFWLFSTAFAVLAIFFFVYPFRSLLVRSSEGENENGLQQDRKSQNVLIFEERMQELHRDRELGNLNDAQLEELETELKRELLIGLEDAPHDEPELNSRSVAKPAVALVVMATAFIVGSVYLLYFRWGAYDLQAQRLEMMFNEKEAEVARAAAEQGDMDALVQQLYDKLKSAPDNVEGWMLLGRTSMNMGKYDLAIESFETVVTSLTKSNENPAPVLGMIAQAYYFKSERVSSEVFLNRSTQYIAKALDANADEPNSIGLLAIMAFEKGNYMDAANHWERLLEIAPEHESAAAIRAGITRAKGLAGIENNSANALPSGHPEIADSSQGVATGDIGIPLNVSLSPELLDQIKGNETVFVFAKAIDGPPMPLAAARKSVSELPFTIRLDESSAMMPSLTLASVDKVSITARVSKSGEPTAQPGDFYITLDEVRVAGHSEPFDLQISKIK